MRVTVRLFAILRERAGQSQIDLDVPDGVTAAEAVAELSRQLPMPVAESRSIAYAVNRAYVPAATVLRDGDELALIPPVSGG